MNETQQLPQFRVPKAVRMAGAGVLCLLVLAATLPSLPISTTGRYGWPDAICIAVILCPLILVLISAGRSPNAERVGWVLLLALFGIRFFGP